MLFIFQIETESMADMMYTMRIDSIDAVYVITIYKVGLIIDGILFDTIPKPIRRGKHNIIDFRIHCNSAMFSYRCQFKIQIIHKSQNNGLSILRQQNQFNAPNQLLQYLSFVIIHRLLSINGLVSFNIMFEIQNNCKIFLHSLNGRVIKLSRKTLKLLPLDVMQICLTVGCLKVSIYSNKWHNDQNMNDRQLLKICKSLKNSEFLEEYRLQLIYY